VASTSALAIAQTWGGDGYRVVAPSRFGYLGSSLPANASPAAQADAYGVVLDALEIERAVVFGYSGGGASAIQFALRHPDGTEALILLASALPGRTRKPPWFLARLLFGSDHLRLQPRRPAVPARTDPRPDRRHQRRRRSDVCLRERPARAARIPKAKLVAIENGGHPLLGSEQRISDEIRAVSAERQRMATAAGSSEATTRRPTGEAGHKRMTETLVDGRRTEARWELRPAAPRRGAHRTAQSLRDPAGTE
jgi:pimeloyl-ACP methyl ester carboxylesterase